jgi:hypothetical protein
MALNNLGFLERLQKRPDEAYPHFAEALRIYRQVAQQNPDSYLPDMAMTLNNLAISEKDQNRPEESRRHYEETLKIRRQLAQQSRDTYLPDVAMTLNDLGNLDGVQQRMEEARQHYEEASKLYGQLAQKDPDAYLPYVAGTLNNLGFLDRNQNEIQESRARYSEALTIYRKLAQGDSGRYAGDIRRVETSLARARAEGALQIDELRTPPSLQIAVVSANISTAGNCGDGAQYIKQRRVRRDVKIEVRETVSQQPSAPRQSRGAYQRRRRKPRRAKVAQSLAIQHDEEPHSHAEAGQSSLQQKLKIVIVRMIDKKPIVEHAIAWKRGGKASETTAQKWMGGKHTKRVAVD